ncbi:MAG: DUF4386 domain-containing protein [Nitrososphaerales archaeon]|nr:DUF4386 domain-containing protein [Nitrososphaerales archaeon]
MLTGIVDLLFLLTAAGFGNDSPQAFQAQPQALTSLGYQTFAVLDALWWILMGFVVWSLGVFIEQFSPSRGRLASVCGIATFVGALGGFTRKWAVPGLAASSVSASPTQQTAILYTYDTLYNLTSAMFTTGIIFQAAGLLLVASALMVMPRFPRWLAALVAISGVTASILSVLDIVARTYIFFPILLIHIIVGSIGLQFALAWRLRRPLTDSMPVS